MLSLLIIAIGTGAIASCLPAFGGDQFARPEQDKQLQQYFAILYFVGNAGVSIFMYSSPYLRGNVHCFNQDSCFPLGFGVSAILMIIALGKKKIII